MIETAALAAIAFLGALIFGITGFGAALFTIPLATHFVPLRFALALFVLVDIAAALSVGLENPKNAVRREWTRLVPMILVGTALGVTLLTPLEGMAGLLQMYRDGIKDCDPAGAYVNNQRVTDIDATVDPASLLHGRYLVLRRGRRHISGVEYTP